MSAAPRRGSARSTLGGRLIGRRTQLRHSLLAGGIDREDAIEAGDLEDLRDVAVAADQRELAVVRAQPLDTADQHTERGGVDEGRVAEIDDDLLAALAD